MQAPERERLTMLSSGEFCTHEYLGAFYGLRADDQPLVARFKTWVARVTPTYQAMLPTRINRYALELFLQSNKLLPRRWAALRLGMDLDSFNQVLATLDAQALLPRGLDEISTDVVDATLVRSFYTLFPSITGYVFGDHNDYCTKLHEEIDRALKIEVKPKYCVTSVAGKEKPTDFAHDLDSLTFEPVGVRYQVWLDFKKPMSLAPDRCSSLFYRNNQSDLKQYKFAGDELRLPTSIRVASKKKHHQ